MKQGLLKRLPPPNTFQNYDVRNGVRDGGIRLNQLPEPEEILEAADVRYGQALIGFSETAWGNWAPKLSGYVIEANYALKVRP